MKKRATQKSAPDGNKSTSAAIRTKQFWKKFHKKFPTDKEAQQAIIQRCMNAKTKCCKRPKLAIQDGNRSTKCQNCHMRIWFTSKTFFKKIERFRAWLAAILSFEQKIEINPCALAKQVGCSPSTAWEIFHKIRLIIHREIISTEHQVSSEQFAQIINRRSRETPKNEHPHMEISECLEALHQSSNTTTGCSANAIELALSQLSEESTMVFDHIGSDEAVHSDLLIKKTGLPINKLSVCLTELEIAGLIVPKGARYIRVAGIEKHYRKINPKQQTTAGKGPLEQTVVGKTVAGKNVGGKNVGGKTIARKTTSEKGTPGGTTPTKMTQGKNPLTKNADIRFKDIASIVDYLRARFHGVSRKYLQLYIAELWTLASSGRWHRGKLLRACANSEPIWRSELLEFVSNAFIDVPFLNGVNAQTAS